MAVIYMARCRANGKAYIGCTSKNLPMRRSEHVESAKGMSPWKFHRALRELGADAFDWSVLESCSESVMYARERFYVAKYDTYRNGLNSTPGGKAAPVGGPKSFKYRAPARKRATYSKRATWR